MKRDYGEWDNLYYQLRGCITSFLSHSPNLTNSPKLMNDLLSPRSKRYFVKHNKCPQFTIYCDIIYSASMKKEKEFEDLARSGYNGLRASDFQTRVDGNTLYVVIRINDQYRRGDLDIQMNNIVRLYKQIGKK